MKRVMTVLAAVALFGGILVAPAEAGGRQEQTITLIDLPASFAVDDNILVQAHVTSGLPLRFDVQTEACAPEGDSATWVDVIGVDPGVCRVRISQAGDEEWAPVEETVNVPVTKAIGGALTATGVHTDDPLAPLDEDTNHFAPDEAIDVVIYEVNPYYDPGASPEIAGDVVYNVDENPEVTAPLRRVTRDDGTSHNVVTFTIPANTLARDNNHTIFARYLGSARYEPNKIAQHAFEVNLVATASVSVLPEHPTVGEETIVTVQLGLRDQASPPVPAGTVSVLANETDLGDHTLVNGRAQFTTKKIPGGAVRIEADYNGDDEGGITAAEGRLLIEVDAAESQSVVVGPGGAFVGDDYTFRIAVTGATGGPVPTGTFELTREPLASGPGAVVGRYELGRDGTVVVTLPGDLPAGNYLYFGQYEGDASYLESSAPVHPFQVVKHEQEITFEGPADLVVGQVVPLAAESDADLLVTFASETPRTCAVVDKDNGGSAVRGLASGSCAVTASQAGNAEYEAADDVTRFAWVARRAQQITFPPVPALSVGQAVWLRATASSGLPVRYRSQSPAKCTLEGSKLTARAVGVCEVVAWQPGNDQWQAAGEKARATVVSKRRQTITFTLPATGVVGRPVPINARASSNLPVVLASGTRAVCTVTGRTLVLHAVGLCRVTASQPGNATWAPAAPVTRAMQVR